MINALGFSSPETEAALAHFHQRHPMVELVISDPASRAIAEGVRSQQYDLGFVGLRPELVPQGLAYRLIASVPVVAVVATNHVHADRPSVTLRQLVESGPSIDLRQGTGLRYGSTWHARGRALQESSMAVSTTDEAIRYAASARFTLLRDRDRYGPRVLCGGRRCGIPVTPGRIALPGQGPTSPIARPRSDSRADTDAVDGGGR